MYKHVPIFRKLSLFVQPCHYISFSVNLQEISDCSLNQDYVEFMHANTLLNKLFLLHKSFLRMRSKACYLRVTLRIVIKRVHESIKVSINQFRFLCEK